MGWEVSLVALDARGPLFDEVRDAGIPVHYLGLRRRYSPFALMRLSRLIRQLNADVLLLRGFSAATLGRMVSCLTLRRPVVVVAEHSTGRQAVRTRWHDLVETALIPATDAFVGVAEGQTEYLVMEKHIPRQRLWIIRNGIDFGPYLGGDRAIARSLVGVDDSAFTVGIVAALRPEKDHHTFLRAARRLVDQHADARFVVVGDGPERASVMAEISRLSLDDHVRVLGARTDVSALLPAFDVFSLSSCTVETFPISVLEAMGSAVAVVATDVGGLPELVENGATGFLVPPSDPGALAAKWSLLHEDPDLRRALGEAGRAKAVAQFSDQKMAAEHVELFERLIQERNRSR